RAQLQTTEAENRVHTAVAVLGDAIGGDQEAEYVLDAPASAPPAFEPVMSLVEEAWRLRPEIKSMRAQHDAAAAQLEYARSQKKPLLNFVFTGGYARFNNVLARQLFASGAGLALPLFTGGRLDGQEEEA